MGDGGVIAQRYALVLFGNAQKLELHPWQANPARTVERAVRVEAGDLVPGQAAGGEPAGRHDRGARQGLAGRRARARGVDDRPRRPHAAPAGRRRHLRRRVRPRSSSTTSRSTRTSEEDHSRVPEPLPPRRRTPSQLAGLVAARRRHAHPRRGPERRLADVGRHARSATWSRDMNGLPDHLGHQDRKNVKLDGGARLPELRQPGRRGRQGVRRHEQRGAARSQAAGRPRRADGLQREGRHVPLADHAREAGVGPRQRLALPGRRSLAARGRRPPVLRLQPLRADGASTPRASRTARTTGPTRTRS